MLIEDNGATEAFVWPGGTGTVGLIGDFGGAGVVMQASYDQGETWTSLASEDGTVPTFTESFVFNFTISPCRYRFFVSDGTNSSIRVSVNPINASNRIV